MLELDSELNSRCVDFAFIGIQTKESGDFQFPAGLRNPAKVAIRAWYDARMVQGRYLRACERLFHIDSARDFLGTKFELAITATELVGMPGKYIATGMAPKPCRVFLNHSALFLDELGQAVGYRTQAELAVIETGRAQVDDRLKVDGAEYIVTGYVDGSDDNICRRVWLERI